MVFILQVRYMKSVAGIRAQSLNKNFGVVQIITTDLFGSASTIFAL